MNTAKTSILVFGIYVVAVGLSFLFVPNLVPGLFGLPPVTEVWIRVLGLLAFALGLYYIQASRDDNRAFYAMTIWGRVVFAVGLIGIALMTPNHMQLILFALVDLAGAGWTWYASRQQVQLAQA
jgi:hypothetical protein